MMKGISLLFVLWAFTADAQMHLPQFSYSVKPAVLRGCIVGEDSQDGEALTLIYWMK